MIGIQDILVYITLGLAVAFLIKKYAFPTPVVSKKIGNKSSKNCGDNDCGCH